MNQRELAAVHRRAVSEAAADLFQVRTGRAVAMRIAPDESERGRKAVDLRGDGPGGETNLVLEHTSVDSFLRQRVLSRWCIELLSPIEKSLDGTLPPPGHYVLGVNPAESEGLKRSGSSISSTLLAWIRETAPTLEVGRPLVAPRHLAHLDVLELGLNVTLYRWPCWDGHFFMHFNVPKDFEEQRRARLVLALEDKCPKLATARAEAPGSESVLVLESCDIALGNEFDIAKIVTQELDLRSDAPDHVYVIDTFREEASRILWSWLVAKEGPGRFPEITDGGPGYFSERGVRSLGEQERVGDRLRP